MSIFFSLLIVDFFFHRCPEGKALWRIFGHFLAEQKVLREAADQRIQQGSAGERKF